MREPLSLGPGLEIPSDEIGIDFARSGGPGGQNVNKVNTKVILRFAPLRSRAFSDTQKALLEERLGPRLTKDGELVIHAERHRVQVRNLEDARGRLASTLLEAMERPKNRKATRPTRGSQRRRLEGKRQRGETKRGRGKVDPGAH